MAAALLCNSKDSIIQLVEGAAVVGAPARAVAHFGDLALDRTFGDVRPLDPGRFGDRAIIERRTIHILDGQREDADYPLAARRAREIGIHSFLATPLLRANEPVGAIWVRRAEVRAFTDQQIALLESFANEAVIAIENARQFQEIEQRNLELADALAQQQAIGEILETITRSPADAQPVLTAIATQVERLLGEAEASLWVFDDQQRWIGHAFGSRTAERQAQRAGATTSGLIASMAAATRAGIPQRAFLERRTIRHDDLRQEFDPEYPEYGSVARQVGYRSVLAAPLLHEERALGTILVRRDKVRPFTDGEVALIETFARQAAIALANAQVVQQLQERNHELADALERQTALADILQAISRAGADVQPVLDTIIASAARLCGSNIASLFRANGDHLDLVASFGASEEANELLRRAPPLIAFSTSTGRAALLRQVVHTPDVLLDPNYARRDLHDVAGYRSVLAVPLLRGDELLGVFSLTRPQPEPFPERQIELVKAFADQAVIAIENARLLTELHERLAQQTAIGEILATITRSPTNAQPVFDAIAEQVERLVDGAGASLFAYDAHGRPIANGFGPRSAANLARRRELGLLDPNPVVLANPAPTTRGTLSGRAFLERRTIRYDDIQSESDPEYPAYGRMQRNLGLHSLIGVPLLHEERALGVINVSRQEVRPFSNREVALVETFASQAAIAVANAQLFQQLQERTRDLAHSVEQLQAVFEVRQAVTSTLDLETVLTTIAARAVELSGANGGSIWELDEQAGHLTLRTAHQLDPELVALLRASPPAIGEGASGRAVATRAPVQIADTLDEGAYQGRLRAVVLRAGFRALLAVPLLHEDRVLGALMLNRNTPGAFPAETVELVKTFASQSAIALQNARLFAELDDKSRQLAIAGQHKSEFLANMSHELRTPLNAIIGFSEVLLEQYFGELNEKQDDYLKDILSSGQHLLSLINDILDLSKVEAGRMELEPGVVALSELLEGGLLMIRERAGRHDITLTLDVDPAIGPLEADERKLKQIVFNLLANAVKFTPDGGTISVTAQRVADGVQVSVRDTGIGIAPEDMGRIFEEFRQAGQDSGRAHEGTGLDLALARRFAELHGGTLWVESSVGVGSTFRFTLPARRDSTAQDAPPRQLPDREGRSAVPARGLPDAPLVLLVEDDRQAADLLRLQLEGGGFRVAVAADGEEGLVQARALRPAAIVLDVLRPRLGGWDFLAQAKADPLLAAIPVVIASVVDERGKGFALGAADYLVKPVGRDALVNTLARLGIAPGSRAAPTTILAIDDDPLATGLLAAILEPEGYRVLQAAGGEEGLALATAERPALIVLDLTMPGTDGFAVVERLRAEPASAAIPIVILSARELTAADQARLAGRVSALARKGEFDRSAFVEVVRRCCGATAREDAPWPAS